MPRRSHHNPEADERPAFGLRDDVFDDRLRSSTKLTAEQRSILRAEARRLEREGADDFDYGDSVEPNEEIRKDREANPPRRGRAKNYGGDGVVDTRMCQTEVAFRTARILAESPLLDDTVYVDVGGAEVNRRGDDLAEFPVRSYLSRWGFTKDRGRSGVKPAWIGFYTSGRSKRKLLVNFSKHDGHITAYFTTGQRLIVHCTAGNIGNTQSPAEHHDLHRAIGRAICWPGTKRTDMIAVCTPRSERFRKMTAKRSEADGVLRAGLRFFHVDRGGGITGLAESLTS